MNFTERERPLVGYDWLVHLYPYSNPTNFTERERPLVGYDWLVLFYIRIVINPPLPCKNRHKKSARRGSNPRPPPWQGGALPLSHSRIIALPFLTGKDYDTIYRFICQLVFPLLCKGILVLYAVNSL